MTATVTLRVPEEWADEATGHWKRLRHAAGLPIDANLGGGETVDRFDGATLVEWIVQLSPMIAPVVTAVLGFVVARKGEIVIRKGDNTYSFKGISPDQIREVMDIIDRCKMSE